MKKLITLFGICFGFYASGQNNYSIQFDGVDDVVTLNGTASIANFGTGNFTVSQWFRSSTPLTGHYCNSWRKFGGTNSYYDITPRRINTGNCVFHFAAGTGQDYYAEGGTAIDDGDWHYLYDVS